MVTMIYTRKQMVDSYDELGPVANITRTPTIITDTKVMAQQLSELYWELADLTHIDDYEVREWNNQGDEWLVEPAYARGCYFLERMKTFKPLLETFEIWKDRLSMPYTRDANGNWNWEPVPCWSATQFGGEEQKEAQEKYEKRSAYVREALTKLRLEPRYPRQAICWEYTEYIDRDYRVKHSVHIVRDWTAPDAQTQTYRQKRDDDETDAWIAQQRKHEEYLKTPEGKAEEEARLQAEADLRTAMGEGGYTSYARNDDGTISMWRD